jgi:hypothetical protein
VEWSRQAGDYGVEVSGVEGLRERWTREAAEAGLPPLDLAKICWRSAEHNVDLAAFQDELAGPHGLTEMQSRFSRRDVIQAFAGLPGVGAVDALRLADAWLAREDVVSLGVPARTGEERFTTKDLLMSEYRLLRSARDGKNAGVAVADEDAVAAALGVRPTLSDEQAAMVRRLTGSGAAVEIVVGRANWPSSSASAV